MKVGDFITRNYISRPNIAVIIEEYIGEHKREEVPAWQWIALYPDPNSEKEYIGWDSESSFDLTHRELIQKHITAEQILRQKVNGKNR